MSRAPRDRDAAPHHCAGCDATWGGLRMAHCGTCHHTFSGLALFDRHRSNRGERGACLDPAAMTYQGHPPRLVEGVWRGPERPQDTYTWEPKSQDEENDANTAC